MRWASSPATGWNCTRARTGSSCAPARSTLRALLRCAANCAAGRAPSTLMPSTTSPMPARYGIDTSILVRLATGDPEEGFERSLRALSLLVERYDAELFASNQVIGEA